MPETLPGGQCRETPDHLARAIRCASDPTGAGSIPTAARPHRSCGHYRSLASPQSLVRGCRFFGPNPYLSPFNVFGPLTFCLIFGVHSTSCSTFNTSRSRRVNNKFSSSIRSSSRLSRGSSHFALRGISHFAATSSPHPPHILCHILGCLNVFGMAGNLLEVPFTPALDSR